MRIIINEAQFDLLVEETDGITIFLNKIQSHYDISDSLYSEILDFIEESGCKKIEFAKFNYPALGLALHNGVLINSNMIGGDLNVLIFVVFHEVAHQFQFKKYGDEIMYGVYSGDVSIDEAAKFMKLAEEVADEFAMRKIRELQKKGLINKNYMANSPYRNISVQSIKSMIIGFRGELESKNMTSPNDISKYFYNMVKSKMQ
jgi:hypothetical protein